MPLETAEAIRVVQWTITFIAITWALAQLRAATFKPATVLPGGSRLLKMPKVMASVAYGSIVVWVSFIVLSTIFPGRTKPADLVWAQSVFAFFAVMSAVLVHCYHTSGVTWDTEAISGPNWYGKKLRFKWEDVIDCAYNESMQAITIKGRDGQTIWLTEYLRGLDELVEYMGLRQANYTIFKQDRYRLPPKL